MLDEKLRMIDDYLHHHHHISPYVCTTAEQRFYIHPAQHITLFTFVFRQSFSLNENCSQPSYSHHNTIQCMLRDEIKTKKTSTSSTYPRHKHNPSSVPIKKGITAHTNGTLFTIQRNSDEDDNGIRQHKNRNNIILCCVIVE